MAKKQSVFGAVFTGLVAAGAAFVAVYTFVVRPWHMRWGTAPREVDRALPGDDVVPAPKFRATHAVTINASAAEVWPWIVQIGQGRGGFYSYDWIENAMGLGIHSANTINPEWQNLQAGDEVLLAEDVGMPVVSVEQDRALVLGGKMDMPAEAQEAMGTEDNYFSGSWSFVLEPVAPDVTRLIERFQLDYPSTPLNTVFYRVLLEPVSFIMERKMLLGIKERAEGHAGQAFAGTRVDGELTLSES